MSDTSETGTRLVVSIRSNPAPSPTLLPAATITREEWVQKLAGVDAKAAFAVRGCGTYGKIHVNTGSDGGRWISGGLCKRRWDCPTCASLYASTATEELSAVCQYLTTQERLKPSQFLFVTLTMRNTIGTTQERVERMNDALSALVDKPRWFKRQVLGWDMQWDFAGSLTDPSRPWINAHVHGLWVIRDGVDVEALKRQVFDYLKERLGLLIGWDENASVWRQTLQPAILSPAGERYITGSVWKGAAEVGGTFLKHDKQRGAYRNYFERHPTDLAEIQPIIAAGLLRPRRGGIVRKVRKLLKLQEEIHADIITADTLELPGSLWRQTSPALRRMFRELVRDASTPSAAVQALIDSALTLPPEDWHQVISELHQAHHQARPTAA